MPDVTDIPNSQVWNVARSIASTALDVATANVSADEETTVDDLDTSAVTERFNHAAENHDVWPFKDSADLLSVVDKETDLTGSPDGNLALSKRVNERLKKLRDPEVDTTYSGEADTDTAETDWTKEEIATEIYYWALGEKDTTYQTIKLTHESPFPKESVTRTKVMNTSGSAEERIEQITEWVAGWLDDSQSVNRENSKHSRSGLGKSIA